MQANVLYYFLSCARVSRLKSLHEFPRIMAEGNSALVNFLSDPATLAALAAVAAGAAWYISSRPSPTKPPIPLDNQSIELPVSFNNSISLHAPSSLHLLLL